MPNLWYISADNEIFVDMDKPATSIPHAEKRLAGAIKHGALDVYRVEMHPSFSPSHVHVVITLNNALPLAERILWGIVFHSDIYRGCVSLMRVQRMIACPDLLVTPSRFVRRENYMCDCPSKHTAEIMEKCPVARAVRGDNRTTTFFAVPEKNPRTKIFNGNIWYNVSRYAAD